MPTARFETETHLPVWTGQTRTGEVDAQGRIVSLQCVSCHRELVERQAAPAAGDLQKVHRDLTMQHGSLSCFSCHDNRADYSTLRLADGTAIPYEQVMTLCSQCHGPQRKDYDHGAHGGMNGYWDLSRGPRERNACTVCHDPHAPAFPKMRPTFKPHDRFLSPSDGSQESTHVP
jgi:hypothetical protein